MGLINLKTDLKSLRYGKDRIGGGDSGQPYIQTNIPDDLSPYIGTQDYINRGGIKVVRDSVEDVKRLGKMFIDTKSPNGIFFTTKQELLSRTAVKTQTSGRLLNEGIYSPLSTLAQAGVVAFGGHLNKQGINPFEGTGAYSNNDRLYYNQIQRLNNTPSTETTLSVENQQLFTPDDPELFNVPTISVVNRNTVTKFSFTNRLVNFYDNQIITKTDGNPNLYSYGGGPGSTLGVGKTNIKFARGQRTGLNNAYIVDNPGWFYGTQTPLFEPGDYLKSLYNIVNPINNSVTTNNKGASGKYARLTSGSVETGYNRDGKTFGTYNYNVYEPATEGNTWPKNSPLIHANNTWTYDQQDIIDTETNIGISAGSPKVQDFRAVLRASLLRRTQDAKKANQSGATPDSPDYSTQNYEQRTNIGQPGQRANKSYVNYTKGVINLATNTSYYGTGSVGNLGSYQKGLDEINSLPIYRSEEAESTINDLVNFRIAVIDNNSPNFKTFLHFRAFLGPIQDSYTSTWNPFSYLGRGEQFYTYNGFTRQMSLSWTVAAQSKEELMPMYRKLNYLASVLTPDYSGNGFMRGNLVQLTIGGYVYEQPGFITGLTFDIQEDTPWEIGIDTEGNTDTSVKQMPHIIRVSGFSFTPIQKFLPEKQSLTFVNTNNESDANDDTGFVNDNGYGAQRYISLSDGTVSGYGLTEEQIDARQELVALNEQAQQSVLTGRTLSQTQTTPERPTLTFPGPITI